MNYDAIVVGGGAAGLTAAAFLAKSGYSILLCEKEKKLGGLINAFTRNGFVYDGGIRAMENSGVLFPMLKQLDLDIEFVRNNISIGIEDRVIQVTSVGSIEDYQNLLTHFYPQSTDEIAVIIEQIKKIMHYMEIQYGIDNPAFLDMKKDREYMLKAIVPWMFKFALTAPKIAALNQPVVDFLKRYTQNQALLDNISQHFFQKTPAFFALSYLKLYLDYYYPLGGTGTVVEELEDLITENGGEIRTDTQITSVDPTSQQILDAHGNQFSYHHLVWAADLKALYRSIEIENIPEPKIRQAIVERKQSLADKTGNDSVLTLFLALDLDPSYFSKIASEHFFYTPKREGQSSAGPIPHGKDRTEIEPWLREFLELTTYEIACPVMRDPTLAPPGKTGLVVSLLFDYPLTEHIQQSGWYQEFKALCETRILEVLDQSIYPGIQAAVIEKFSSTPLTMQRYTGNTDGAITGWSFTNHPMPAEHRLPKIFSATDTPIPNVVQAGQWTYSPSGFPIALLTGKLASDRIIKELNKSRRKSK